MAIAGVKPVDVDVFHVNEDQIEAVITGKGVDETTELYTHNQVRDILLKFDYWRRHGGSGFVVDFMKGVK
jgi:hypothetical protein